MGAPLPLVLVDLLRGRLGASVVAAIHETHPRVSLIAVVEPGGQVAEAYEAGALATVPPDLEALKACIANIISNHRDVVRGRSGPEPESGPERLRRLFGDLRSGMMSATMALNLMHVISESVERAVLFLVNKQQLASLGAFGRDRQGRMLAMVSRGLRLTLDADHALARAVRSGQVGSLSSEDADLPEPLRTLLGRPRTGQTKSASRSVCSRFNVLTHTRLLSGSQSTRTMYSYDAGSIVAHVVELDPSSMIPSFTEGFGSPTFGYFCVVTVGVQGSIFT